jgi:hypothetical protein
MLPMAANPPSTAAPVLSTTDWVFTGPALFVTVTLAPKAETDVRAIIDTTCFSFIVVCNE